MARSQATSDIAKQTLVSFLSVELEACMVSDSSASVAVLLGFMPIVKSPTTKLELLGSPDTLERIETWPKGIKLFCKLRDL